MSRKRIFFSISIFFVILIGCNSDKDNFVLKVNDFQLSKGAFSASYSIAPNILKMGSSPEAEYLTAIKNEYMISQQLIDEGYGNDSTLNKTLRLLKQELIVEKMFHQDVDANINISEQEIKNEILKGNKQVKVKYIYVKSSEEADQIKNDMTNGESFESIQSSLLSEYGLSEHAGETGFINYGEIAHEVNEVIFSIKPGVVSEPIKTHSGFFFVKVVDVRKTLLSQSDIKRLTPTYKKILLNKKMNDEGKTYIKKVMDPLKVVVKGKIFNKLVNAIYKSYKHSRNSESVSNQSEQGFLRVSNFNDVLSEEFLNETLISTTDKNLSVKEMLCHFSYYPVSFSTSSINNFADDLKKRIGIRLRDIFLEREGIKRGYQIDQKIVEELSLWKQQLITYRYMQRLTEQIKVDTNEVKKIYKEKLKGKYPFNKIETSLVSSYKDLVIYRKLIKMVKEAEDKFEIEININITQKRKPVLPIPGADVYSYKMGLPYSRLAFAVPNRIWAAENIWNSIINR